MRKFKYNKLVAEIDEWLSDDANKKFCYGESVEQIKAYLSDSNTFLSPVKTSLISTWCLSNAIKSEIHEHEGITVSSRWCLNALYSCICGYGIYIDYVMSGAFERDTHGALGSITEPSFYMAIALRMGCDQAADSLYKIITLGKQKDYFYEDRICLSTFVSGIYEYMKHGEIDSKCCDCSDADNPYIQLLGSLSLKDTKDLDSKIYNACDYHIEHSCASTSRRTCEFEDDNYAIYPVEILLFLDVLTTKRFDISNLTHPLIDTPLRSLGVNQSGDLINTIDKLYKVAQNKINKLYQ